MVCKNCGVELDDDVQYCPLCGKGTNDDLPAKEFQSSFAVQSAQRVPELKEMSKSQKKFTWEIVSLIVLSGAVATFFIDFVINNRISWSELPVAFCLSIFSYVSLFAFSNQTRMIKFAGGFLLSSFCLVILDAITGGISWSIWLGIPLLFVTNLVVSILVSVSRKAKYKGINLIAYCFVGATLICISIEALVSYFKRELVEFQWSVLVAACVIPVVIVLLFAHFRLKKGRSLEKTFHV